MFGWSPEVANEFILLGVAGRMPLDHLQIQRLIYLAHGWSLVTIGQPLTGDRPEAWEIGPIYRRIATELAPLGRVPIVSPLDLKFRLSSGNSEFARETTEMDQSFLDLIAKIYNTYGGFSSVRLSAAVRRGSDPWRTVYANGAGKLRDISHMRVRDQFLGLANELDHDRADG